MCRYKKKRGIKDEDITGNESEKPFLCNQPKAVTETEEHTLDLKTDDKESANEEDTFLKLDEETDAVSNEFRPRFSSPVWLSEIQDRRCLINKRV